jgi:4-hydroxybenzoate polyprenyltransferase
LGLLANHAIFLPLLFPAVKPGAAPVGLWLLAPVFALLLTQNQLLHEESDAAEDEAAGVTTTARRLGVRGVRWAVLALAAGIVVAGALAGGGAVIGVCVVGAAATAAVGLSGHPASLRRRAHRYLAAMVGVALFLASLGAVEAG